MIPVFVFSFNRAQFLKNCLNSIRKSIPAAPVIIIDDNSDDGDTKKYLASISESYEIISNINSDFSEFKTGGLCGAMKLAMEISLRRGYDYVLFIQDDMQIVRRIDADDLARIENYFSTISNSIQISTTFVRRLSADDFLTKYDRDFVAQAYIRKKNQERGKSSFSDTGVFAVGRYFDLFGEFLVGEDRNSAKARDRGLICGRSFYPFMNWLPYPSAFRGKQKSFGHKIFEYFGHSGYYPIEMMSDKDVERLLQRDPNILPIMEDFLLCPSSPRSDIWSTGGGEYNFIAYDSIPARAFILMRKIKSSLWTSER
ncbi:MAG: glycosyltransferase family 2 protein [Rhodobacteraceae bacterium]|nr:MAG: glycosyltransferase family 2 protein [Paracoccaceae bacterium]